MADDWELTTRGAPDNVQCFFCDQVFHTEVSERQHVKNQHPKECLHCPACKDSGFLMPSDLMRHIELGKCDQIGLRELNSRRDRKNRFRRQLEMYGPVRNNFTRFIDKRAPAIDGNVRGLGEAPHRESPATSTRATPKYQSSGGSLALSDISAFCARGVSTSDSNMALLTRSNTTQRSANDDDDELLVSYDPVAGRSDDNRGRYYNEFGGKYHCPHARCQKTFKSNSAVEIHLRSSAHSDVRHTCPQCHKEFHSLQGITAHAEDGQSRCGLARRDNFSDYMEQLTGGLIDVKFDEGRNRIKYETSVSAEAEFEKALMAQNDGYKDYQNQMW